MRVPLLRIRRRSLLRGLGVFLGISVLYLGVVAFYVGGPEKLFEREILAIGGPPDGTEEEIGGGWILEVATGESRSIEDVEDDPLLEGFDPPGTEPSWVFEMFPGKRYLDEFFMYRVQYRRRRIQRWVPLHLLGID